jgi:hypothetical protein
LGRTEEEAMRPIDLEALRREAQSSPRGESYAHLESYEDKRVGVGARIKLEEAQYFVEVVIPLCRGEKVNIPKLEKKTTLLKTLEKRGYTLICEDDGSISCEIELPSKEIDSELVRLAEAREL